MATAVLPAGMESIFITGTTQAAHKVRTGEDLTEEHPYGFVSRQALLDEIQFKGAISDFHALKDKLKKYSAEQVLFVWDVEEVYGNNFLIAVTESARDAQLDAYRAAQAAAAAAAAAAASAADARDGAPDEADAAVTSKPWESRGSEKEVEAATVSSHRPYLLLAVSRARSEFGLGFKLADRDAHDGFVECRPFKDPNFELRRATRSAGTQEVAPLADARTQTEWFRPLNKATQAEPQPLDPRALAAVVSSAELRRFLAGARVLLEGALQQNELVDIYGDDLALLAEDDASVGNRSDNDVRELQSFSRSSYSHERVVTASHWKPGSAGIVGVSLARKHGFEERVEVAGRVHVGHVLIWSFADPITPLFALEAPQDVLTFVFNPHTPNLVLAGVTSGQLVLWDLDDKPLPTVGGGGASGSTGAAASGSGNGAGGANAGGGAAAGADGDEGSGNGGENQTVHLAPCGVSAIEHSHHRAITAIAWLPLRHEVTPGARLKQDDGGGSAWQSWQCATTACDGYVCFWDVRLARKETAASASRVGERERRRDPDDKAAWDAVEAAIKKDEWLWVPVCRILLHKLDASTELGCAYLELCGVPHGSKLYAATDEGELAMVEIAHVPAAGAPPEADNADFTGVKSVLHGHVGPAVALQRSPFFRDIYLTVGAREACGAAPRRAAAADASPRAVARADPHRLAAAAQAIGRRTCGRKASAHLSSPRRTRPSG